MEFENGGVHYRFGTGMTGMVKKLLIINFTVWILQLVLGIFLKSRPLTDTLGLYPEQAITGFQVWRLITYGFLHAPKGIFHILFNMLGLFFFGPDVERNLESGKHFLLFYLGCTIFGGLCQGLLGLAVGSNIPIIGASAAVLGVIAGAAIFTPNRIVILFIFPMKLKHLALLFVVVNLFNLLISLQGGAGNVAHLAHLGGMAYAYFHIKKYPVIKRKIKIHAQQKQQERKIDEEEELDRILKKIHEKGMSSLTGKERDFLMDHTSRK